MTNVFVENITTQVEIEAGYDLFEVVIEDFDQAEIRRYAEEAAISAAEALASEEAAADSADAASASEIAAAGSATSASNSANSATASASTATTQAGIATTQAGIATTQAGIATTKANEASASAAAALASENDAETAASTATTQAGIATTQAGIATTKADEASTSAANALTSANTATTQAGIATTQAGNALTSANNAASSAVDAAASAASAAQVGTSTLLTGYTVGPNTAISATDTILQAFGEVQGQINARVSGTLATGQVAFGTAANTVGGDADFTYNSTTNLLTLGGGITLTGAQTIQTSTGNLTLATAAGNGNIVLRPNGTGVVSTLNNVGIGISTLLAGSGPIITTTLTSGGSGYVDGTYVDVASSLIATTFGSTALFTIVVSGGIVTTATLTWAGVGYRVGDTLTVSNTLLGGTGSGLVITVNTVESSQLTIAGNNGGDITLFRNDTQLLQGENIGTIKWQNRDTSLKGSGICAEIGAFAVGALGAAQLSFFTSAGSGADLTERWSVLSTGQLQSNGAQTIQTSTGNLTLATAAGNGNIVLSPNGTGAVLINPIGNASVLVGLTTSRTNFNQSTPAKIQSEGISFDDCGYSTVRNSNSAAASTLKFGKSRGTANLSNTIVQNGDSLGVIEFQGADGTNLIKGSEIRGFVSGTPSLNNMPGGLSFWVNGIVNTTTQAMTLFQTGNLLLQNGGTFTDAGFRLDVNGTARVKGNLTTNLTQGSVPFIGASGLLTQNNSLFFISSFTDLGIGTNTPRKSSFFSRALTVESNGITGTEIVGTQTNLTGTVAAISFINNSNTNTTFQKRLAQITIINDGAAENGNLSFGVFEGGTFRQPIYIKSNGNVLINTTTDVASSILTVESTTKGFLPPRMTTTQKNAIASPVAGLVVYDTTLNKLSVRTAAAWETVTSV